MTGIYDIDYNTVKNYDLYCTEIAPLYRACKNYMLESYDRVGAESISNVDISDVANWITTPVNGLKFGKVEFEDSTQTFVLFSAHNLPERFRRD